ncbi:MAG TPA: mismatch-specific DNA-glycosylase [Chloroflexota bacterium]|nr:mismatch-specific DNA-glycosylase [Chloroflexota bacterium]
MTQYDFPTLPDLLRPGLGLVFVGINPSIYSVQRGHYFARSTSRFWPAFSRSKLSVQIRHALGRDTLGPEDDVLLIDFGIGFTDVVKMPSSNASAIKPADYALWAPRLLERLEACGAGMVCFHGVTGYRAFARYALHSPNEPTPLGLQERTLGNARIFLAPNPSPANAHFRPEDQVRFYDELSDLLDATERLGGVRREPDPYGMRP